MKANVSISILFETRETRDHELKNAAKDIFKNTYGTEAYALMMDFLEEKENEHSVQIKVARLPISVKDQTFLMEALCQGKKLNEKRLSVETMLEMYNSGDDILKKKSKEYMVVRYEDYIRDVIHRNYSTYAIKYHEELFQCGAIGLLNAMENYRKEKSDKYGTRACFITFARPFIVAEISNQIYHLQGTSKSYSLLEKQVFDAIKKCEKAHEKVTLEKIASMTGLSENRVQIALDIAERKKMKSINSDSSMKWKVAEGKSVEERAEDAEIHDKLEKSMKKLSEKMKKAVYLKFYEGRTTKETAAILGVTTVTVNNWIKTAFEVMKRDPELINLIKEMKE